TVEREAAHHECSIDDELFFHCPHLDDAVLLILEIVETPIHRRGDNPVITVAWGLLPIGGYGETILEYSRVPAGFDLQRVKLYPGSPKVLTFSSKSYQESVVTGTLEASLYSHSLLSDAVDYFPDFCIIGNRLSIPGLVANDREPQLASPAQLPRVLSSLDEISLSFGPHAERIEKLILEDINIDRLCRENLPPEVNGEPMQVLERRLRVTLSAHF
ncbi:unnamed protein product, partial [Cylicostephanus goldi]